MRITFTYISKIVQRGTQKEIIDNQQNDKMIEFFPRSSIEIATFLDLDIANLTVTGGQVGFTKLDFDPRIGFEASVEISRILSEPEMAIICSHMTEQMDELYFGPDGLYCDLKDFECYILPVHPELEKRPIRVTIDEGRGSL